MPILLQINASANWGSTGKIAEQIGKFAIDNGWDSYIAYGRHINPSRSKLIKIGGRLSVYSHYFENIIFDNEGKGSRLATLLFLREIDRIKPDIIHLHNIHDHYLNYPILFRYLRSLDIPIVWTQHDCWSYTGGCNYYTMIGCNKWQNTCSECPQRKRKLFDHSTSQQNLRKELFAELGNLTIVPVSNWLCNEIKLSFLKNCRIETILNGVDTDTFFPNADVSILNKYSIRNKRYLLGVASVWDERKCLKDYIDLSHRLNDVQIVLVGLNESQRQDLPENVIGIPRTQNVEELVSLYSCAAIVLNLSKEETFGLTTIEGMACGIPSVVYNCTASPELITPDTGAIVEAGNLDSLVIAVNEILSKGKDYYVEACRKRACNTYNNKTKIQEYINLYLSLLYKI